MDALAEASGVGNMTLYRHFPSKDDVVAYLEERDRRFWEWFDGVAGGGPAERLGAVFAALPELLARADYRGCPFLNAATEFPEPGHPARRVAVGHKRRVRERLRALAEDRGHGPGGAVARTHAPHGRRVRLHAGVRRGGAANRVGEAARGLLERHLPSGRSATQT